MPRSNSLSLSLVRSGSSAHARRGTSHLTQPDDGGSQTSDLLGLELDGEMRGGSSKDSNTMRTSEEPEDE
jgi:hypothetical protein